MKTAKKRLKNRIDWWISFWVENRNGGNGLPLVAFLLQHETLRLQSLLRLPRMRLLGLDILTCSFCHWTIVSQATGGFCRTPREAQRGRIRGQHPARNCRCSTSG